MSAAALATLLTALAAVDGGAVAHDAGGAPTAAPAPVAGFDAEALGARLHAQLDELGRRRIFSGELMVARRGQTVRSEIYGEVRAGSIYRIGSITKSFTALAIMVLVEAGKLTLADPVGRFFPEIPADKLGKDGVAVTIDHLLSHRSGLEWRLPQRKLAPEEIVTALAGATFQARPGDRYAYSNPGFTLLGEVIRRLTGRPYEAFLRAEVLAPLRLPSTGIVPADETTRLRLAPGLVTSYVGLHPARDVFPSLVTDYLEWDGAAAGGVFSSVVDLTRFCDALMAGQFLGADTRARLFTPILDDYARGFVVEPLGGRRVIWHNGALPAFGFQSFAGFLPEDGVSVVVLSNVDGAAADLTPIVHRALAGQPPGAVVPDSVATRVVATARVLHLGPILAVLVMAGALLPAARRPRAWPRALMLATGAFFFAAVALFFTASPSCEVGLALAAIAAALFVARVSGPGERLRGEAPMAIFGAGVTVLLVAAGLLARYAMSRL